MGVESLTFCLITGHGKGVSCLTETFPDFNGAITKTSVEKDHTAGIFAKSRVGNLALSIVSVRNKTSRKNI